MTRGVGSAIAHDVHASNVNTKNKDKVSETIKRCFQRKAASKASKFKILHPRYNDVCLKILFGFWLTLNLKPLMMKFSIVRTSRTLASFG